MSDVRSRYYQERVILATLVALTLLLPVAGVSQTLVNGDFEGGNTGGVATGWTSYLESGATGAWVVQTAGIVPQGLQYQQVQITTANKYGGVYQLITGCTPCTTYVISGQYRTNSTSATVNIMANASGSASRASASTICAGSTSTAWSSFSGQVTATGTSISLFLDTAVTTASKAGAFDAITIAPCTGPAVPTGAAASPSTLCGSASSTLTASVAAGCTVDWYAGSCCGTLVGSGTSLVVTPGSTTTYYPRARNTSTGCGSAGCGTPVTVTVVAGPTAPGSPAATPASITSGQSSTLTATPPSGCTVDWYTGSCGGTLVGSGSSLVVTPGSTTTYYPQSRNTTTGCLSSCGSAATVTVTIPAAPVHFVKHHTSGIFNGLTWDTAFDNVQDAVDASVSGNEVWVASGTYVGNVVLPSGIGLYGGFAGTETLKTQRNWFTNTTVLDANWAAPVVEVVRNAANTTRIDGFTLTHGRAVDGGGIYCNQGASPIIANNVITGNSADYEGGGVFLNLGSTAVIACNKITNNGAVSGGGGVRSVVGSAVITNNFVAGNSAKTGGGICVGNSSTASTEYVVNNTVVSNTARQGGGIFCDAMSSASLANNIVAFNYTGVHVVSGTGTPTLRKNDVYGNGSYNYSGVSAGSTDINADPLLASVTYGNLHIQNGSPCKNTGNGSDVVSGYTDVDGQTRVVGTVDIGADESDGTTWTVTPSIVRVSTSGSDSNNGSSWGAAKRTIQAAINAAAATGGEVWVKAGTYSEQITLRDYVYVYGGFAGTETARSQRNFTSNISIIDAADSGSVANARLMGYRVGALDGFKLQNGDSLNGGGLFCDHASPLIENNIITGNTVSRSGGGIYLATTAALVQANSITSNTALGNGGGIYCEETFADIYRNSIENNSACIDGCGIFSSTNDYGEFVNNRIVKNKQNPSIGGAWGTAMAVDSYGGPTMVCNTIAENSPGGNGAIYCGVYGTLTLRSNIVAFNGSGTVTDSQGSITKVLNCYYSNSGSGGTDIVADPVFVNRAGGDYRLQSSSPCINAADVATAPLVDYLGLTRSDPDIGCYEYGASQDLPVAPTSASATPSALCAGSSTTLHATGGSGTTLRWLTGSCTGTSVGTGNDLVVAPAVTTTYYCRWETSLGNSTCASTTVTVSGTAPTAAVGGPQTIEPNGTTAPLGGNTPTPPATGAWSVASGGTGTFSGTTDPNATFTHTGGTGPIILRWTVSNPPCTPGTADVTVTVGHYCLTNGNFDGGFTSGVGNGWTAQTPQSGTFAEDTTIKHSGTSSQKVTDSSGQPSYTTYVYQQFSVRPGKVYVPTMWIYRVNSAIAHIGVDPDGGTSFGGGDGAPASNQWTYRVHDAFTAGAGGLATIGLAAGFQTDSGTIYYDDVSVIPQEPQTSGGTATVSYGASATITAGGGFGGDPSELCWYTGAAGTGVKAGTGTSLVVFPTSTTTYYPRWEADGECGISADGPPVTITVLPPAAAPTVTSITPWSGPNTGTTAITSLAGTGFASGASVKLRRTGYSDIPATAVVVGSSTQITCSFGLTGKKTGLWDVIVTNADAQSGTLANGFAVTVANTLPVVGTLGSSLLDSSMTGGSLIRQVAVWGRVELINSTMFWVDDGSGERVKVYSPGYTGIVNNDYVSVRGTVDVSINPSLLICSPGQIVKYN